MRMLEQKRGQAWIVLVIVALIFLLPLFGGVILGSMLSKIPAWAYAVAAFVGLWALGRRRK